jgi:hypothetical protein
MIEFKAQLPAMRSGAEYLQARTDLQNRAQAVSKTDNDTDYREDFVKTRTEDGATLTAQFSTGQLTSSSGKWDDYDNVRTQSTSFQLQGDKLTVTEASVVDRDNCDYETPWTRIDGAARTLQIDVATGEIVEARTSSYEPSSKKWS